MRASWFLKITVYSRLSYQGKIIFCYAMATYWFTILTRVCIDPASTSARRVYIYIYISWLWFFTLPGEERYIWYSPPKKTRCSFERKDWSGREGRRITTTAADHIVRTAYVPVVLLSSYQKGHFILQLCPLMQGNKCSWWTYEMTLMALSVYFPRQGFFACLASLVSTALHRTCWNPFCSSSQQATPR